MKDIFDSFLVALVIMVSIVLVFGFFILVNMLPHPWGGVIVIFMTIWGVVYIFKKVSKLS